MKIVQNLKCNVYFHKDCGEQSLQAGSSENIKKEKLQVETQNMQDKNQNHYKAKTHFYIQNIK